MPKIIRIALLLILIFFGGRLALQGYDRYQNDQANQALQNQLMQEAQEAKERAAQNAADSQAQRTALLAPYQRVNTDVIGYLSMPNPEVAIAFPLVQGSDNDYYLHHALDHSTNYLGSVFIDYHNKADFSDQNTVIYGHNMGRPGMFFGLSKFREQDFLSANQTFTITLPEQTLTYQIFSVYVTEPEYDYRTLNYLDPVTQQDFLDRIIARSMITSDAIVTTTDHLVTLSTCVYDFDDARLAIHAVLIACEPAE